MGLFTKVAAKGIFAILPEMLKDHKGKWSSKRTVSGVLAIAAVSNIDTQGITWQTLCLALIAVLPLCFMGEPKSCKCDKDKLHKIFNKKQ